MNPSEQILKTSETIIPLGGCFLSIHLSLVHGIEKTGTCSYGVMRIETQASGSRSSVSESDQRLINAN